MNSQRAEKPNLECKSETAIESEIGRKRGGERGSQADIRSVGGHLSGHYGMMTIFVPLLLRKIGGTAAVLAACVTVSIIAAALS